MGFNARMRSNGDTISGLNSKLRSAVVKLTPVTLAASSGTGHLH
jgi:hypothetical protein